MRLAAELAFRTDFARHARHFRSEGAEAVDHLIDHVLDLQDLALRIDRDLLRQITIGDRGRDLRHVAQLHGEVAGHGVHAVGQALPRAADALHLGLHAELSFGTDFTRDARHLTGERIQLIHHGIDGVFQLQNLALGFDHELLRQIPVGDRGHDAGDAAHLSGQVRGHAVHAVGQVLPRTGDAGHVRLAAQLAFGAYFARDARHFVGEGVELIDHGVDGRADAQKLTAYRLAFDLQGHLLRQVPGSHRGNHARDFGRRTHQIADQRVERVPGDHPTAAPIVSFDARRHIAVATDHSSHARKFASRRVELLSQRIERISDVPGHAFLSVQTPAEVAMHERGERFDETQAACGGGLALRGYWVCQGGLLCRIGRASVWGERRMFLTRQPPVVPRQNASRAPRGICAKTPQNSSTLAGTALPRAALSH